MDQLKTDFDGVFRFTNPTEEDFKAFWNNKEYTFPAGKTVPMIIQGETLEGVQEIRKMFAYKLSTREFYKGNIYDTMKEQGRGLPPMFDEKILEPMIEQCLKPLPMDKAIVRELPKNSLDKKLRGSKAVSDNDNLSKTFADDVPVSLGKM